MQGLFKMKWYTISTFVNSLRFVRILKLILKCESIFYLVFIEIGIFHHLRLKPINVNIFVYTMFIKMCLYFYL